MVSTVERHVAASALARSVHPRSARHCDHAFERASKPSRASACSGTPRPLLASKGFALRDTARVRAKSEFDPVVKSCKRVPTARTKSASLARALEEGKTVTPIAPSCKG